MNIDNFDVLRIIATDAPLCKEDRDSLRNAADELEDAQRRLVRLYFEHTQLQQQLIAVNDQLIDARKELAKRNFPSLSMNVPVRYP